MPSHPGHTGFLGGSMSTFARSVTVVSKRVVGEVPRQLPRRCLVSPQNRRRGAIWQFLLDLFCASRETSGCGETLRREWR